MGEPSPAGPDAAAAGGGGGEGAAGAGEPEQATRTGRADADAGSSSGIRLGDVSAQILACGREVRRALAFLRESGARSSNNTNDDKNNSSNNREPTLEGLSAAGGRSLSEPPSAGQRESANAGGDDGTLSGDGPADALAAARTAGGPDRTTGEAVGGGAAMAQVAHERSAAVTVGSGAGAFAAGALVAAGISRAARLACAPPRARGLLRQLRGALIFASRVAVVGLRAPPHLGTHTFPPLLEVAEHGPPPWDAASEISEGWVEVEAEEEGTIVAAAAAPGPGRGAESTLEKELDELASALAAEREALAAAALADAEAAQEEKAALARARDAMIAVADAAAVRGDALDVPKAFARALPVDVAVGTKYEGIVAQDELGEGGAESTGWIVADSDASSTGLHSDDGEGAGSVVHVVPGRRPSMFEIIEAPGGDPMAPTVSRSVSLVIEQSANSSAAAEKAVAEAHASLLPAPRADAPPAAGPAKENRAHPAAEGQGSRRPTKSGPRRGLLACLCGPTSA